MTLQLNDTGSGPLGLLLSRRSGSAKRMTGYGPTTDELDMIFASATRVPDHGKLTPWRFILFEKRRATGSEKSSLPASLRKIPMPTRNGCVSNGRGSCARPSSLP